MLKALLGALGRTYIAQVTYCDGGLLFLAESWEMDRHDSPETKREREADFAHAATMLRATDLSLPGEPRAADADGLELASEKQRPNGELTTPPPASGSKRPAD